MSHPQRLLELPAGAASHEAALFLAMLDDQLALLIDDTRELSTEALEYQPGPGHNTIGMLLAHLAIVEVFWLSLVLDGVAVDAIDTRPLLGIGDMDDGLPLPEGAAPPQVLAGRELAWFHARLLETRHWSTPRILKLGEQDFARTVTYRRANGELRTVSVRWTLYHVLEHFSGHYGQILALAHLHRSHVARVAGAPR